MLEFLIIFVTVLALFLLGIFLLGNGLCYHKLIHYQWGDGDGVGCSKCGLATYYFPLLWLYRLIGRVEDI